MTQSIERPLCVSCRKMFTDEEVAAGNYDLVGMGGPDGKPSFRHQTCPGRTAMAQ